MPRKKKLPLPHEGMTPEARGALFLQYVEAEVPLVSARGVAVNFSEASLVGADLHELDLTEAMLDRARLDGADMAGISAMLAHLTDASFKGANLQGAMLREAFLGGADFTDADLEGADLGEAHVHGAIFRGANLRGAQFDGADLEGANFEGARNLTLIEATGARISKVTYERSGWDADTLRALVAMGAEVVGLNEFPADAVRAVILKNDGLTLTFAARLSRVDRFMVDGMIIGVLGPEAEECEVAELFRADDTTIVRLTASDPALLLKLAMVIEQRASEARPRGGQSIANFGPVEVQYNVMIARDPEVGARLAALERLLGPLGRLDELLGHLKQMDLPVAVRQR